MSTNDGGPAFPFVEHDGDGHEIVCAGMTLRDYFAAKAMQVMLADEAAPEESIAKWAYRQADAMLAAREAK